jgi:hypothetical protein
MSMTCTVCRHKKRKDIDRAVVDGQSNRRIATQFKISESAVQRHTESHLPRLLAMAKHAGEVADADDLLEKIERILVKCETISANAEKSKDWAPAVSALGQMKSCIELLMRVAGMMQLESTASKIWKMSPDEFRAAISNAADNRQANRWARVHGG